MTENDKTRDELRDQYIKEIKSHQHFDSFFAEYKPSTVESFVKLYALKKAMWTLYGPTFKSELERLETLWVNAAMERMAEIQQVKLFLFQCRYRAGEVEEPVQGLNTIFDFLYWKDNVLNATFLDPVTEEDVDLYCEYMRSNDYNHQPLGFLQGWQDFDRIRMAYNSPDEEEGDVPEWYEFYFSRTGHGTELTLPDIKKEKDIYYFQKGNNERTRLLQEEEKKAIAEKRKLPPEEGKPFDEYSPDGLSLVYECF